MKRSNGRQSPLKLGTRQYGKLDPRVAFTNAFAPYFAKVEIDASESNKRRARLQTGEGSR